MTTAAHPPCSPRSSLPTDAERLALAGYRGLTREGYALDLRQFTTWARATVTRVDYESDAAALDRNELGALLVIAGLGAPTGTR